MLTQALSDLKDQTQVTYEERLMMVSEQLIFPLGPPLLIILLSPPRPLLFWGGGQEVERLREGSARELADLKASTREMVERENKALREARSDAVAEADRARAQLQVLLLLLLPFIIQYTPPREEEEEKGRVLTTTTLPPMIRRSPSPMRTWCSV